MEITKTMKDGTIAVLTSSKEYYAREMYRGKSNTKSGMRWDKIEYYDLQGNYIPLASGKCAKCRRKVQSRYCGHYAFCGCGFTSVDTDRRSPEIHRITTSAPINWECACGYGDHCYFVHCPKCGKENPLDRKKRLISSTISI